MAKTISLAKLKSGDPIDFDPSEINRAVGNGIAAFAHVEAAMTHLFCTFLIPAPEHLCAAAYDAALHVETKIRILRAVGQHLTPGVGKRTFNNLINRVINRQDTRNKLAHWIPVYIGKQVSQPKQNLSFKFDWILVPRETGKVPDPKLAITIRQLNEFATLCTKLSADIRAFADMISTTENPDKDRDEVNGG